MPKMPDFKIMRKRKAFEQPREFRSKEYDTRRWRELRKSILRDSPICVKCDNAIASVVDHIQPVRLGGNFWDVANLQALCEICHNRKSGKEGRSKPK